MTIAMLSLAGVPATAGFIGKFYLIDAAVAGDYAWLGDRDRARRRWCRSPTTCAWSR